MANLNLDLCPLFAELLSYPNERLKPTAADCERRLKQAVPGAAASFSAFIDFLEHHELPQIEELYTATFDLQAICYPYIGYQLCGESQARTLFLMKLQELYTRHKFSTGSELPDHLSVILHFIGSTVDQSGNAEIISDALLPALEKIIKGIENEEHPYRNLLCALQVYLKSRVATGLETERPQSKSQKGDLHG